ncbi:toll/interleukin-1 receptor domain-containing protein [Chitinophaga filiformis]|uniref:TIR domain-containing protein n=1 Tax=Chitinophaga filiformis TaxID=104663 RepID=A0A1G7RY39_CHIFI|nr:toll/interleukin-1 receptor domain-containing protein [Chitinophaga filiformis]SDG15723.1 TIR domain-containing protein [Chitinophaga filiformis]
MKNNSTKFYLFNCSYAERTNELGFIQKLLASFNHDELTGITLLVNNNPYNFEFLMLLIFEQNDMAFDNWLSIYYPNKKVSYLFNYSMDEIVANLLNKKQYTSYSFSFFEQVQKVLTEDSNEIFIFPGQKKVEEKWGKPEKIFKYKVFLSYSSKDKEIAEAIFKELQKEEVKTWFDIIEVKYGDSILDRLNEGLAQSDLGVLCFSKNFLAANWPKREMNYFLHERMSSNKINFLILNLDLDLSDFPPLFRDYKHINLNQENWLEELINRIRELSR